MVGVGLGVWVVVGVLVEVGAVVGVLVGDGVVVGVLVKVGVTMIVSAAGASVGVGVGVPCAQATIARVSDTRQMIGVICLAAITHLPRFLGLGSSSMMPSRPSNPIIS
jgi:hypothetical protein